MVEQCDTIQKFLFFKLFCGTHSHVLFWSHWYPSFRFLVMSPQSLSGFCLICIVQANVMYIPWNPPLVLHITNLLMDSIAGHWQGSYLAKGYYWRQWGLIGWLFKTWYRIANENFAYDCTGWGGNDLDPELVAMMNNLYVTLVRLVQNRLLGNRSCTVQDWVQLCMNFRWRKLVLWPQWFIGI